MKCKVTVKQAGIKAVLNGKTVGSKRITLRKGRKYKLKSVVVPYGKVAYKSKNKKVASVSFKGTIKARKKGETMIVITANGMKKKIRGKG